MVEPPHPALAQGFARHVGDPVAMVIAETRDQARDAANLLDVDYEQLPAVADVRKAVQPGAPQVWEQAKGNVCFDWHLGDKAATDAAFARADKVVSLDVVNNRLVPNAMEPRAAIGEYDKATGELTLTTTSQNPHLIRLLLAAFSMGVPESKLRVVAPDVGGGFGSKIYHYAEEVLVPWAARQAGPPGQVDRGALRVVHVRRAWPRPRHRRASWRWTPTGNFLGLRVSHPGQHGRLPLHLRAVRPDLPLRHPASPAPTRPRPSTSR